MNISKVAAIIVLMCAASLGAYDIEITTYGVAIEVRNSVTGHKAEMTINATGQTGGFWMEEGEWRITLNPKAVNPSSGSTITIKNNYSGTGPILKARDTLTQIYRYKSFDLSGKGALKGLKAGDYVGSIIF